MPRQSPRKAQNVAVEKTPGKVTANGSSAKAVSTAKPVVQKANGAAKRKSLHEQDCDSCGEEDQKVTKKAKPGKAKASGDMVLAERTAVSSLKKAMYIGAHISSAGGVQNSVQNAVNVGSNAFALFLKSQRQWNSKPLSAESKNEFGAAMKAHGYDAGRHVLPHGSYLVNLAQADAAKAAQAYEAFVDDLRRCEALGVALYNFHPGSTLGDARENAIGRIAQQLNKAHAATKEVVTVLENMAGGGNTVGATFEDLRDVIELVEDKSRVGVCIDTCHAFAAGYDLRTPEAFAETVRKFDEVVGLRYLKAFHLNDSKAPFNSKRDVHANIGTGFLGLRAFHSIVNHGPFAGLPMVLETPIERKGPDGKVVEDKQVWADEIKLLEGLIGADPEADEFRQLEAELSRRGADERKKFQGQADKKAQKGAAKAKGKRGKKARDTDDDDSD